MLGSEGVLAHQLHCAQNAHPPRDDAKDDARWLGAAGSAHVRLMPSQLTVAPFGRGTLGFYLLHDQSAGAANKMITEG
eukprot:7377035-Prymnesium_polylepis.1